MQLIANGPDIPAAVLHSQEEGKLVFFCGAGISMPSGLPSFKRLVEDVRDQLGAAFTSQEKREFDAEAYDRVLGMFESDARFGIKARQKVVKRLATVDNPQLGVHKSLLTLARRPDGARQLVTTNFDNLFQIAEPDCHVSAAPELPIPKPGKWDGLVHLHGRIVPADPNGRKLVFTSADFGVAYLVERWAARFVSELFQQFDVAFVGYSVNDPVMRYLVDAVAVERHLDRRLHTAYAFAECQPDKSEEVAQEWRARGIEPILYNPQDGHAALRDTLAVWASKFNGGLLSKTTLVSELAVKEPEALPREEHEHFCWAIGDPSGAPARHLVELGQRAKFGWIKVLENFRVLPRAPHGDNNQFGLVGQRVSMFPLDAVGFYLAAWIAQHAGSVDCLQWVREHGGVLHPTLKSEVLRLIDRGQVPREFAEAWRLIASFRGAADDIEFFRLATRLKEETFGPALKLAVLDAFHPTLNFGERLSFPNIGNEESVQSRISRIVAVECEVAAGHAAKDIIASLQARADWPSVAVAILPDVNALLLKSLDLMAASGQASQTEDLSYVHHPSIAPHSQNRHFQGWTWLIELVRMCVEAGGTASPETVATVSTWTAGRFPVLRRLALHAARTTGVPSADSMVRLLESDPEKWLWNARLRVELFPLLRGLRSKLSSEQSDKLVQLIAAGPPEALFREGLTESEHEDRRDRLIWERLARLFVDSPSADRPVLLDEIEDRHEAWKLSEDDRDAFLFWIEVGWGLKSDVTADTLASLPLDRLVNVLEQRKGDEGVIDRWNQVAKSEPEKALHVLDAFANQDNFARELWSSTIYSIRQSTMTDAQKDRLLDLIDKVPPHVVESMLWEMGELLQGWSGEASIQPRILAKTAALLDAAAKLPLSDNEDLLFSALNAPTGKLAGAALEVLGTKNLERKAGLPTDLKNILTDFVENKKPSAILGRVMIASRLAILHDIDPEWTERVLLPHFDWANPTEARGAWQGFLWSPWVRPSLWAKLKPYALQTADHLAELGEHHEQFVPFMVSISVDGDGALSHDETRALLKKLGPSGLALAAYWLESRVSEGGTAGWKAIAEWIVAVWPKELAVQAPPVSQHLARLPALVPDRFPEIVDLVSELIGAVEHGDMVLGDLEKEGLATLHPEKALILVDRITPDAPTPWFGDLKETLQRIAAAAPELVGNPRYVRLLEISTKAGI
jgi:hypothetical protein